MALNLGIYSADMSYSSLFDQTQSTLNFMGAARQLAERLGVLEAIVEATIRGFGEKRKKKEWGREIISKTLINSIPTLTSRISPPFPVMYWWAAGGKGLN